MAKADILLLPTALTTHTVRAILADPIRLNSHFGRYTNFVKPLNCAAIAILAKSVIQIKALWTFVVRGERRVLKQSANSEKVPKKERRGKGENLAATAVPAASNLLGPSNVFTIGKANS